MPEQIVIVSSDRPSTAGLVLGRITDRDGAVTYQAAHPTRETTTAYTDGTLQRVPYGLRVDEAWLAKYPEAWRVVA